MPNETFLLRISSATVECERSEFTSLPQVERIILPLSGSLHLFYEGHGKRSWNRLNRTALTEAGKR